MGRGWRGRSAVNRRRYAPKHRIRTGRGQDKEHPDLSLEECAKNLGIGLSTLSRWRQQFEANDGDIPVRGSGNYASDEQKEIARLKRELRDTQDALDVLKKAISILGKE